MKKNLIKLATLTTVFALGVGLAINTQKQPIAASAAQHTANYADFTYSGSYYNSLNTSGTDGLTGTFYSALSTYIYPKAWYTYSGGSGNANYLSGALQEADEDPTNSNNMVYLYTRDSVAKNPATTWNREHVWPQSLSGTNPTTHDDNWGTSEAGTDILHLRPTYNDTNSKRGNKLYGYISGSKTAEKYNGMEYGYVSGNYFEPLDSVKGDVARIVMYIYVAYNAHYGNSLNILKTFASYDTLIKWHTADKPDALEGVRNDFSETSKQKNRNPFVDHPEYAWRIFGDSCSSTVKNDCMAAYPGEGGQVTPTKTVQSIAISGTATKTAYYAGDTFNPTGLTVTATYDDSTTATIANNQCTWTPNPLTVGTTSVTCKYGNFTATYSGITVSNKTTPVSGDYEVTFRTNSADGSSELSSAGVESQMASNTLVESISGGSKVFAGASGLKLGSGSAIGEFTFTLVNGARNNIEGITIKSTKYGSDSGKISVKFDNNSIASDITPGVDYTKTLNRISASTITISTTSKRAYINSIELAIHSHTFVDTVVAPTKEAGGYTTHTCSVCGYSYRDSETDPISLVSISAVDNRANTGYQIGDQLDLTVTAKYSDNSTETVADYTVEGFNNQVAGEQNITVKYSDKQVSLTVTVLPASGGNNSSSSAPSSEPSSQAPAQSGEEPTQPSQEPTPTSQPSEPTQPEEKSSGGCSGSVVGTLSLTAFSALIGLVFVFSKRKHQ